MCAAASSNQKAKPSKRVTDLIAPRNLPLAYFNMPKAACTTIKNLLYYIEHGQWFDAPLNIHRQIKTNHVLLRTKELADKRSRGEGGTDWTVFSFVRNPAKRVYSTFVEKVWADGPYSFPPVQDLLKKDYGYKLNTLSSSEYLVDDVRQGFKSFLDFVVENLAGNTRIAPNPHWMVQHQRLKRTKPADYVSLVGRVESFEKDMAMILTRAGWSDLSIVNRRFNEGPKAPFGWEDVADGEILDKVSSIYKDDFTAFDYKRL